VAVPQCGARSISDEAQFRCEELAHSRLVNVEVLTDLNAALVAAGDSSATRTVYGVVIALGVIGVALLVLTIWLFRQTKPEPQLLAPLERMDDRAWRKQEPAEMRRDLDSLRPTGARPVTREKSVPDVDAEFAQHRPTLGTFDDLQAEPSVDLRRSTTGGADPLLAATAATADSEDETAEPDVVSAQAASNQRNTNDAVDARDEDDTGDIEVVEFDVRPTPTDSD
jgi:hypothetical protein